MAEERKKSIHQKLLKDLSDEIVPNGQEHESLTALMKSYVPAGLVTGKSVLQQFEALARKGVLKPGKYEVLEKICLDSGNDNLIEKIELAKQELKNDEPSETRRTEEAVATNTKRRPDDDNVVSDGPKRRHTEDVMRFYPKKEKRGLMLILNAREDRKSTDLDVKRIKGFFEDKLHYTVFDPRAHEEDDFTTEQLDGQLSEIRNLMNSDLGKSYYCFICVILSHGNCKGIITKDKGFKKVEDIRKEFDNQHVPEFVGRPKVFLIQACRGSVSMGFVPTDLTDDEAVSHGKFDDESDVSVLVPTDADTLLAFSTTPGYRSFRRLRVGSWFITECMRVFEKYYKQEHVEEMLITVRNNIAHSEEWQKHDEEWQKEDRGKQMPCVWSTLTRRLML